MAQNTASVVQNEAQKVNRLNLLLGPERLQITAQTENTDSFKRYLVKLLGQRTQLIGQHDRSAESQLNWQGQAHFAQRCGNTKRTVLFQMKAW